MFESSCFSTQRFKNLPVLKHAGFVRQNCSFFPISISIQGDSKISAYKTQKFFNLRVSMHGDSKTLQNYWNMARISMKRMPIIHGHWPEYLWRGCLEFMDNGLNILRLPKIAGELYHTKYVSEKCVQNFWNLTRISGDGEPNYKYVHLSLSCHHPRIYVDTYVWISTYSST